MSIGEKIKKERLRQGISQEKLGEVLNVTQQAVAKWEKSISEPDCNTLKKLASLFGISVDELLGYTEFTSEEKAAGFTDKRKVSITPIEDDMLYEFRQIGKKRGEEAQRALITIAKNMQ